MRTTYALTAALLVTGSITTLITGQPAGAQLLTENMASPASAPAGAPMSFADLSERLQPAVVNIAVKSKVTVGTAYDFRTGEEKAISQEAESGGSGFFISQDGLIVTNNHVVVGPTGDLADSIIITTVDGREYKAELVGRDATSDLAVLRVKGDKFPYVKLGDSNKARVGEWVVAIGNPLGVGSSVTAGIISAVGRNTGAGGAYDRFIQTDTAINPGNSGGPLFNLNGEVIGINNRQFSLTRGNIGINFSIPSSEALPVIEALRGGKRPERGYLGLGTSPLDTDTAETLGIAKNRGEFVGRVVDGEAGDKAGIVQGDIVLAVNGEEIGPDQTLAYLIAKEKPGAKVKIDILRKGKKQTVTATVGTRPTEEQLAQSTFDPNEKKEVTAPEQSKPERILYDAFGMAVQPLTSEILARLGLPKDTKGVLVTGVTQYGTAARAGMQRPDIIVSANYEDISTPEQLAALTRQAKEAGRPGLFLGVLRPGSPVQYATVRFDD